jgi:hypothetical protein
MSSAKLLDSFAQGLFGSGVKLKNRVVQVEVDGLGIVDLREGEPIRFEDGSELSEKQQKQVRSFMRKHFRK